MIAEVHRILIEPTFSIEGAGLPLGVESAQVLASKSRGC
jgi:hypothetical protein